MTRDDIPAATVVYLKNVVREFMDRCNDHGILWQDFYAALQEERALGFKGNPEALFERTFTQMSRGGN